MICLNEGTLWTYNLRKCSLLLKISFIPFMTLKLWFLLIFCFYLVCVSNVALEINSTYITGNLLLILLYSLVTLFLFQALCPWKIYIFCLLVLLLVIPSIFIFLLKLLTYLPLVIEKIFDQFLIFIHIFQPKLLLIRFRLHH